ncbi:hypothetical protein [Neptuniibacter marinus]|uniref:hypothetical protein n=1 Tax=Neptuniibacter marinus TaxID=1806670 RepID=UPI000B0F0632|nr:hypothetical protein [Neptuniibacter marinus]
MTITAHNYKDKDLKLLLDDLEYAEKCTPKSAHINVTLQLQLNYCLPKDQY